ncbi:uncharacterized protein J4E87_002885 [Alternaria ethzedia]|uniref:uncharacterized protein n=1 Tax=Alternaria ethzedia TaxID=181014 RepID=UPI0020C55B0B|nr:uncharacterized protein J4E87_002885 [Alternaria ethzedia]KAI4629699.1 hypothetical protein J4E87_002885 [Alternaria ethzedia]
MDKSIAEVHTSCVSIFLTFISVLATSRRWNDQNEAQNAFDKYRLWAGNVEATQVENIAARNRITDKFEPSDTDEDETDSSDSPWEVSSDSEVEYPGKGKLPRQTPDRPVPEPAKPTVVDPINFIIDCLWKLPIRSPAPIDRMKKKYTADITAYLPFDIMYIRDKFPNLNETVTTRLAKMISRRRQLIQYRKDHTDALQGKEVTVRMVVYPDLLKEI